MIIAFIISQLSIAVFAQSNAEIVIEDLIKEKTELRINGGNEERIEQINEQIERLGGEIMTTEEVYEEFNIALPYSFVVPSDGDGIEWNYYTWESNGYIYDRLMACHDGTQSGELYTSTSYDVFLTVDISSAVLDEFLQILGYSGNQYANMASSILSSVVSAVEFSQSSGITGVSKLEDIESSLDITTSTDVSFIYVRDADLDENYRVLSLVSSRTYCSVLDAVFTSPIATYTDSFWVSADNYNNSVAARNAYNGSYQPVCDFSTCTVVRIANKYNRTVYFPCPQFPSQIS